MPPVLALPFPAIDPVALEVGPLVIRWYALAYIAGIFIGWWVLRRLVRSPALWGPVTRPSEADIDDFIFWATIGIILGGRIGFVLFYNLSYYLDNPLEIPQVWKGGMAFHGGFLGVVLAVVLFSRGRVFSAWTLFDLVAIAAPIGILFGRIANFINGELWGRVTDVPWAMVFPAAGLEPRHPSQIYQAGLEGIGLMILISALVFGGRWLHRPGFVAGAFVAGYGVARFVVEFFREPDAQVGYLAGAFTMGQLLSTPMIVIGVGVMIYASRRSVPAPA